MIDKPEPRLLWTTSPHLAIASHTKIIEAWGFRPSTVAFVWVKQNKTDDKVRIRGQSSLDHRRHRTRDPRHQRLAVAPRSQHPSGRDGSCGEHSEKPEEVRRRVERLFPGPYLELYGRKPLPNWTVWGNGIPRGQFGSPILEAAE